VVIVTRAYEGACIIEWLFICFGNARAEGNVLLGNVCQQRIVSALRLLAHYLTDCFCANVVLDHSRLLFLLA